MKGGKSGLLACLTMATALAGSGPAYSATITVTTTADELNQNDECSLREAVQAANLDMPVDTCRQCDPVACPPPMCDDAGCPPPGADDIVLPAGVYTLTLPGAAEDLAATGDLDIRSDTTIDGEGASNTIIQACAPEPPATTCPGIDRVLHVDPAGAGITAEVRGVTIENGRAVLIPFVAAMGGGVLLGATNTCCGGTIPSGRLTISDSVVRYGYSERGGGGVANRGGTLTVVNSTVSDNSGAAAIYNDFISTTTLIGSAIRGNLGFGLGGAILTFGGTVTVLDSTISGNIVSAGGGGIAILGGELHLTNSTVSGNRTEPGVGGSAGGGIYIQGGGAHTINGSTITDNAANGTSGAGVGGGGIAVYPNTAGTLTLTNTILAGNRALVGGSPAAGPDCLSEFFGRVFSGGHNLIGNNAYCAFTPAAGDQVGTSDGVIDPRLGALAANGGPTLTHALFADSPAVDGGTADGCRDHLGNLLAHDQRGEGRTMDGNGDGMAECDIGGFELASGVSLSGVRPNHAGNTGAVCAIVYGGGFADDATVKLKRAGEHDIPGEPANVGENGSVIATAFDLAGKTPGAWDLMVMHPDGSGATRAGAFTVEEGGGPKLWADVLGGWTVDGRGAIGAGRPTSVILLYGNRGNADAHAVPLVIGVPEGVGLTPNFPVAAPPTLDGQLTTDWSGVSMGTTSDGVPGVTILPLLVSVVPAGFTGALNFTVFAPGTSDWLGRLVDIQFSIGKPYVSQDDTAGTVDGTDVDGATADGVTEGAVDYAERVFGERPCPGILSLLRDRFVTQMDGVVGLGGADWVTNLGSVPRVYSPVQLLISLAEVATTGCGGSILPELPRGVGSCAELNWRGCTPPPCGTSGRWPGARACGCPPWSWVVVGSRDPNDKAAPTRPEGVTFLTAEEPLRYAVFFENVGNAPAQKVVITDPLDMANLKLETLSFGPMTFGSHQVLPPPGLGQLTRDVDLRPDEELICRIEAGVDVSSGLLTWSLTSIDPATGEAPANPLVGCLPANTVPPEGDGSIVFTVDATPPPSGTEICNRASIVFDSNPAIETPDRCVTMDNTPPVSQVDSAQGSDCSQAIDVRWSGTDVGSSLASFTILVSENGGPPVPWLENTTSTQAAFTGRWGREYAFSSVASDIAQNAESAPAAPDASVTVGECTPHDFAVTRIVAPRSIALSGRSPFRKKQIKVQLQNRSPVAETVADVKVLKSLVELEIVSLAGCPEPVVELHEGKPQKPLPVTLKHRQKLNVVFDVTFDCANDPLKSTRAMAHGDYEVRASVDHGPLGGADAHVDDDTCPRSVAPPFVIDPYPDGRIRDSGCGMKKPDKTFGAPVVVDVVVKP